MYYVCWHVNKDNRKTQSDFKCVKFVDRRDNADINAALNILAFGNGAAGRGGGEVTRPDETSNRYYNSCGL